MPDSQIEDDKPKADAVLRIVDESMVEVGWLVV